MPSCPVCGRDAPAPGQTCPECGGPPSPTGGGGPGATDGAAGEGRGEQAAGPVPWEDRGEGLVAGLARTWKLSLIEPVRFFGRIRDGGRTVRALVYYALVASAGAAAVVLWERLGLSLGEYVGQIEANGPTAGGPVFSLALYLLLAAVLWPVLTVAFHLGAVMTAPRRRGLGATARAVCYASSPAVLTVVLVVGAPVATAWWLVLQVVGLREVHRTTLPRALLMMLWAWGALLVLGGVAAVVARALGL